MRAAVVVAMGLAASARANTDKTATLHVKPPALSADGATIALPVDKVVKGHSERDVVLAPTGQVDGESLELVSTTVGLDCDPGVDDSGCATDDEDHTAEVDARLAGYVGLPYGTSGAVDGVTVKVSGTAKKRKLTFREGKKVVATAIVKASRGEKVEVGDFVVVRGAQAWIYVVAEHEQDAHTHATQWTAVKAKL